MVLTGLPGRPIHGSAPAHPEADRRAGPHPDLPELEIRAQSSSITGRRKSCSPTLMPAVVTSRSQSVAPREVLAQALPGVARDAQVHRHAARLADQRHEGVGVRARDLPAAQDLLRLVHVHDLVAAAEDRHPRPPEDQRMGHRERGQHAESGRAEFVAGAEHRLALSGCPRRPRAGCSRRRRGRAGSPPSPRPSSVSSCRMTLSAPSGSGAPVKIRAHSPGARPLEGNWPAAIRSTTRSRTGRASLAPRTSAARAA